MEGKVKFYNSEKGFGFITGEDEKDVFFHISNVENQVELKDEQAVSFEVEQGDRGAKAVSIKLIE